MWETFKKQLSILLYYLSFLTTIEIHKKRNNKEYFDVENVKRTTVIQIYYVK